MVLSSYEAFTLTKAYAGFGQYTRFIRPGMALLPTADPQTLAAWDARKGTLTLVAYNDTDQPRPVRYDLSGFAALNPAAQVSRTSLKEDLAALSPLAVKNHQLGAGRGAETLAPDESLEMPPSGVVNDLWNISV